MKILNRQITCGRNYRRLTEVTNQKIKIEVWVGTESIFTDGDDYYVTINGDWINKIRIK